MKVESDNRKKGSIAPKAKQQTEPQIKTVSKNKYLKIGKAKVLTPKDIKLLPYEDYLVFGDTSIKNCPIRKEDLEAAKANNLVIILFKKTKDKDGSTVYAFSEKMDIVRSYRKGRLAVAIYLESIGKNTNRPHQTKEDFIKSEFESELEGIELEAAYLLSENTDLLEKDIKRLITCLYETNGSDKRVQGKNPKNGLAKVK